MFLPLPGDDRRFAGGMGSGTDKSRNLTATASLKAKLEDVDSWDLLGFLRCLCSFCFLLSLCVFGTIGRQYTRVSCDLMLFVLRFFFFRSSHMLFWYLVISLYVPCLFEIQDF